MLRRKDLVWLLAWPVYQLIGTLRHEGSHALAALLAGVRIRAFAFWPSVHPGRGLLWGYVAWEGRVGWPVMAAPYLCDLLTYALSFCLLTRLAISRRWVWLNLVVVGLASPLVNSLYNYLGALRYQNDVAYLLRALPGWAVHVVFLVAIAVYAVGLALVLWERADLPARLLEGEDRG